jgi:hypothetical protein
MVASVRLASRLIKRQPLDRCGLRRPAARAPFWPKLSALDALGEKEPWNLGQWLSFYNHKRGQHASAPFNFGGRIHSAPSVWPVAFKHISSRS